MRDWSLFTSVNGLVWGWFMMWGQASLLSDALVQLNGAAVLLSFLTLLFLT